ncbi:MAG: hypothetical protein RL220_1481 [Bacteroidota bacterium]
MKKSLIVLVCALFGTTFIAQAQSGAGKSGGVSLKSQKDSANYALGITLAEELKKKGIQEVDFDMLMAGLRDQMQGKAGMDPSTAAKIAAAESKKAMELAKERNKVEGAAFLEKNAKEPGVLKTASGLQYKHTKQGAGPSPDANDKVTVHYTGRLLDGYEFDSSVNRGQPATFGLNQVIKGWTEGLQLMKEGGKATLYIPFDLAYGPNGSRSIPGYATLIFDIELIKVEKVD